MPAATSRLIALRHAGAPADAPDPGWPTALSAPRHDSYRSICGMRLRPNMVVERQERAIWSDADA